MRSFLISRPGLREGYYIPLGIHILDTSYVMLEIASLPIMFVVIFFYGGPHLVRHVPGVVPPWFVILIMFAILMGSLFASWAVSGWALRCIGKWLHILTDEQAAQFPPKPQAGEPETWLPWPESWQLPRTQVQDTDGGPPCF